MAKKPLTPKEEFAFLHIRLTTDQKRELEREARKLGVSVSLYVRMKLGMVGVSLTVKE